MSCGAVSKRSDQRMWNDWPPCASSISMSTEDITSCSQRPLPRVVVVLFGNLPPHPKTISKRSSAEASASLFGLFPYSDFLFLLWANPDLSKDEKLTLPATLVGSLGA